jgi:hypothetical protein
MTHTRKEAGPASMARAPLLALFLLIATACDSTDRLASNPSDDAPGATAASASTAVHGIPFGASSQPVSLYGPTYTGGLLNPVQPESLLSYLATIRAAKARVVLAFSGGPLQFTNPDGTFNLGLWKTRVARYNSVDFSSYINDGTVTAHYLIDQPNCTSCWGGQAIPQDTVEAMAQYSKSLWPGMATIARADATWLAESASEYVSLDAAWIQYVVRKGDVNTFLADNVAAAQAKGLGLMVGLNLLKGNADLSSFTASQIKNFGSVLLGSSYACGFISWQYDAAYFARADIKSALELLSKKAKRHVPTSCQQ